MMPHFKTKGYPPLEKAAFSVLLVIIFLRNVVFPNAARSMTDKLVIPKSRSLLNSYMLGSIWLFYFYDNMLPLDCLVAAMFALNCFVDYIGGFDNFFQ